MKSDHIKISKPEKRPWMEEAVKAVLILLLALVLCEGLYRLGIGQQNMGIVMVLAILIISAITDGYLYGLGATVAGVLIYGYLLTEPRFTFSVSHGFSITVCIMLLITLATSTITAHIKSLAKTAQEKERRAGLMYELNSILLSSGDEETIAQVSLAYLHDSLGRSTALHVDRGAETEPGFYFSMADGDLSESFFLVPAERRYAQMTIEVTGQGGKETDPARKVFYLPLAVQDQTYGAVGVSLQNGPLSASERVFAELVAQQTSQALHVLDLATRQRESRVTAETEKARNSFLRGISHDLRTPLTSIIGASGTFLENRGELPEQIQVQLISGIQADAQWLLNMVENILSVTRIHQDNMTITKTEEAAEEVVGEAVSLFRRRHPDVHIEIKQSDSLLLVPMDALLITQVFNNLLDNARRYGGKRPTIVVEMAEAEGFAQFTLTDSGPGIAAEALPTLFEIQPNRAGHSEDAVRGHGMGLSICKTIVEVHGGWIRARNLPGGGAQFTFALPMAPQVVAGE
ncbi:MAG TPA: ATP-binding protein [Pseudoflavonifractor sp.]|nr:ATP-binding protein [Pseudoflavonifractor sp.]